MTPPYEIDIEDAEYLRHGDKPFLARIFKPRGKGPFPAVVELHGGAWCEENRSYDDAINGPIARGGVVVVALDFRAPPEATYPGSVADANYGIRWLKANAASLGSRSDWVGVMGTSSGGHLAVLAGMKPHDPRYSTVPLQGHPDIDARVGYVVALWPVICPQGRYRDYKARLDKGEIHPTRTQTLDYHHRYWLTQEAMADGSPMLALERKDPVERPPILCVQHPEDKLHPRANLEQFVAGYRKAGGTVEVEFLGGETYDLVRSAPASEVATGAVARMVDFIQQRTRLAA